MEENRCAPGATSTAYELYNDIRAHYQGGVINSARYYCTQCGTTGSTRICGVCNAGYAYLDMVPDEPFVQ